MALAIGAVTPGCAITQASATSAGLAELRDGNGVECRQDAKAARVEIAANAAAARAFAEIGLAAVLAAQKPLGEAEIGDDADLFGNAQVGKRAFEREAVVEIVLRLQHLVARQRLQAGDIERRPQLGGIEIGGAGMADLALGDQLPIGAERFLVGHRRVRPVRQIEVDRFDLQPLQRALDRLLDIGRREASAALAEIRSDLGDHDDAVAIAAALHPFADDGLGFAAAVARRPARIALGGVDGIEPCLGETVEQREGGFLVGRPAEHVAAEDQRRDFEVGSSKAALFQWSVS